MTTDQAIAKLRSLRAWLAGPTCPMAKPQADVEACDQILAALAAAERRAEAAEKRLAGVLTLVWEIDRHGEDRPAAIRRFKRLRRAVQGECYPFTAALAAALPGEGEGR
jgi:hypothetical protein